MWQNFHCVWFEKYGGPEFWQRVSEVFYTRIVGSPALAKYFTHLSQRRIREIAGDMWQIALSLTGNECEETVINRHGDLCITEFDYELYVSLLRDTLTESGVEAEDVNELVLRLREFKSTICSG